MRRKNLLEAFKHSDESPGGTPAPVGSGTPPKVAAPAPTPGLPASRGGAGPARSGRSLGIPLALIGVALAFALGYLAGRRAPAQASASAPDPAALQSAVAPSGALAPPATQPRAFQAPVDAADAAADEPPRSIEESALFDPRNLYTVAVASYGKNHPDLAWATYEHLKEAGLEVFPPIESGNMLALFVGATPTLADLADTEAAIKKLTRDGKKAAYGDAYRARIDKLIPRKTGN
jgi:hypothetical protein